MRNGLVRRESSNRRCSEQLADQVLCAGTDDFPLSTLEAVARILNLVEERVIAKRGKATQEDVQDDSERPHVGLAPIPPDARDGVSSLQHLGREILRCAAEGLQPIACRALRESEVGDLDVNIACFAHQQDAAHRRDPSPWAPRARARALSVPRTPGGGRERGWSEFKRARDSARTSPVSGRGERCCWSANNRPR